MSHLYLDCYICPSDELSEVSREINSVLVERYGSEIDFTNGIEPHITMYMGLFPEKNFELIFRELSFVLSDYPQFKVKMSEFRLTSDGYLFWDVEKSLRIIELHKEIINSLNSLREGLLREKYKTSLNDFSQAEQANINKFGFPFVLEEFKPHLTLGKISGVSDINNIAFPEPGKKIEFFVSRLGLGNVGNNGSIIDSGHFFILNEMEN